MRKNLKTLMCLALLGMGTGVGMVGLAAQETPATKVETVATLPGGGSENLTQSADGAILITGMADKVVYKVSSDGRVEQFASIPEVAAVLGVAAAPDGGAVLTVWATRSATNPGDLSAITSQIVVLDKAGKVTATLPGEKGAAFNGIDAAGKGVYLAADMSGGAIWQVDPAQKKIERWLSDPLLIAQPFGVNGLKVHNGWVYVSVTGKNAMYRVQMDPSGKPQGSLMLIAEGVRVDDFDVAKDGSIYAPSGDAMYKIAPNGTVSKVADKVPGGPASMVSSDGRWVYWTTRGGGGGGGRGGDAGRGGGGDAGRGSGRDGGREGGGGGREGGRGGGPATAQLLRIAIQ